MTEQERLEQRMIPPPWGARALMIGCCTVERHVRWVRYYDIIIGGFGSGSFTYKRVKYWYSWEVESCTMRWGTMEK